LLGLELLGVLSTKGLSLKMLVANFRVVMKPEMPIEMVIYSNQTESIQIFSHLPE
jgi:hypothetical protein